MRDVHAYACVFCTCRRAAHRLAVVVSAAENCVTERGLASGDECDGISPAELWWNLALEYKVFLNADY